MYNYYQSHKNIKKLNCTMIEHLFGVYAISSICSAFQTGLFLRIIDTDANYIFGNIPDWALVFFMFSNMLNY